MFTVILSKLGVSVGSFNAETLADAQYDANSAIRRGAADSAAILPLVGFDPIAYLGAGR